MPGKSKSGEGCVGIFYLLILVVGISKVTSLNWFASSLLLLGIGLIVAVIVQFVSRIQKASKASRVRKILCVHGVAESGLTCTACASERERVRLQREIEAELLRRRKELQKKARELELAEMDRLSVSWRSSASSFFEMHHRVFEDSVCDVFRKLGYSVIQTPYVRDGGKDGILEKDGAKYVLECKRYVKTGRTGRPDIQKLLAAMHDEAAQGAIFVTTGMFSSDAIDYARKNRIQLYDRKSLPLLVNEAYGDQSKLVASVMCLECGSVLSFPVEKMLGSSRCAQGHLVENRITISSLQFDEDRPPTCSNCNVPMRLVKHGSNKFWGCTNYPKCRQTKDHASRRRSWKRKRY